MTLTQELTTIESIVALTISDLRAVQTENYVSRELQEGIVDAPDDCRKDISDIVKKIKSATRSTGEND